MVPYRTVPYHTSYLPECCSRARHKPAYKKWMEKVLDGLEGVAAGEFIKVKGSYKLSAAAKAPPKKKKAAPKKKTAPKKKVRLILFVMTLIGYNVS